MLKDSITYCLSYLAHPDRVGELAISRKWLDGGMAFMHLSNPEALRPLRFSVGWFVNTGQKIHLVLNEDDRTIDPPFLGQFLVELVDHSTVRMLDPQEFAAVLPLVREIVEATAQMKPAEWRQGYADDVVRYLNFI